jgi:hypothetical protein
MSSCSEKEARPPHRSQWRHGGKNSFHLRHPPLYPHPPSSPPEDAAAGRAPLARRPSPDIHAGMSALCPDGGASSWQCDGPGGAASPLPHGGTTACRNFSTERLRRQQRRLLVSGSSSPALRRPQLPGSGLGWLRALSWRGSGLRGSLDLGSRSSSCGPLGRWAWVRLSPACQDALVRCQVASRSWTWETRLLAKARPGCGRGDDGGAHEHRDRGDGVFAAPRASLP